MSMMDHPFHQHTNAGLVLEINEEDTGYTSLYASFPTCKDTINVPSFGGNATNTK
jgi:FtsP/CotA-like multicopper oxidase with cupredoxin domain